MTQAAQQFDFSKMRRSHKDNFNSEIKVAIYGRVSTQHEEQLEAFDRQLQWYEILLERYKNWKVVKTYDDKSSGTRAKSRKGFMTMIDDAQQGEFDLIITREVCRFARNTVDSLEYTRMLKKYGVEVYFASDGIWSFDNDGELRLTMFSGFAQEESRKVSERVYNGQMISRQNGQLYGNGNILGYDLVRGVKPIDNTYIINPEQGATVRRIYELCLQGEGFKSICSILIAENRKDARGLVVWNPTKINRILRNKTYCGYIGYNKSNCVDYLSHKRKNNSDRSTYVYVKGNFEPIISEDDWNKVQETISAKTMKVTIKDGDKEKQIEVGRNLSHQKWIKKLVCSCGKTYKKYLWRENKSGEQMYGYQCRNQVENRKRSYRVAHGLDGTGYCDVPSICEWKLEYMFHEIFHELFDSPKTTVDNLYSIIAKNYEYVPEVKQNNLLDNCIREKELIQNRYEQLLLKFLDGKIDETMYEKMKADFEGKLKSLEEKIAEYEADKQEQNDEEKALELKFKHLEQIRETLSGYVDFSDKCNDKVVEQFVDRVVPQEDYSFKWYINLCRGKKGEFNEADYELYDYWTLGFKGAQKYRKKRGRYLRPSQWHDIKIEVYIKM